MRTVKLYKHIICLTALLISVSALSEAQIMSDYTAYPPSVLTDSPANLMLMIDNSGSMVDLQYLYNPATDPHCYDSSYDNTATYTGYFEEDVVYEWKNGTGTFGKKGAAISSTCVHTTAYLCVDIGAGLVTTFEASGRFLNWLSASRLDVLKKILTGGKYDAVNGYIEAESRGCTGRRHIKAVPGLNITFGVRGYANDPNDLLQVSSGGNTVIEIFDGSFDPTPCQLAATLIDDSQGQFKGAVDDCLAMGKLDDSTKEKIKGERSTFNHTIHGCYKKAKGDAISSGTINATMNSCEKVYETSSPGDVQSYEPSYICSDRRKACTNTNPAYICDEDADCPMGETCEATGLSGFFGECWLEANPKVNEFSKNNSCEEDQMNAFCDTLKIPQIIDPTLSTADTTDQLYLPAFLMDSGLFAQAGYPVGQFPVKIEISSAPTGLIDAFQNSIRFGVMRFNYCGAGTENLTNTNIVNDCQDPDNPSATDKDGSKVVSYIGDADTAQAINNIKTATWTPFSEAFYNIIAYYVSDANNNPDLDPVQFTPTADAIQDPLNSDDFAGNKNPIQFRCQKNNILIISDGASTADINPKITGKVTQSSHLFDDNDAGDTGTCGDYSGSTYLDDLSYYANNRNIFNPSDIDLSDDEVAQHITSYVVYIGEDTVTPDECDGITLMDNTARNGGTTLYNPKDPEELGKTLRSALLEISADVASGSAASVLSSSTTGEGAVYHAQYYPKKWENLETRSWLGYMQSLFIDSYGNLREDSDNDDTLDTSDSILKMEYTIEDGTKIFKCSYTDTEGNYSCSNQIYTYEEINPVWAGGKLLWQRDPDTREIFTSIDGYSREEFVATNNVALKPYLREDDDAVAAKVINWVRGKDFTHPVDDIDATHPNGYRKRDITIGASSNIWKLGDIVHSAPTLIGPPSENFDLLYGDASYAKFWLAHKKRLQVSYVGANDGMLHAFNAGCYDALNRRFYSDVNGSGECFNGTHTLGEELWAFIPRGLLPHLQWLTDPEYTHVYYVDLKPKVSDVKIFDDDGATNVGGWGTILIGGMRLGGDTMDWTHGTTDYSSSPEYFALDITDPIKPRLLWTFSNPDLGLTMSYPSVARIGSSWYVIFGSGATEFDEESNLTQYQNGNIFVLKISGGTDGVINTWTENSNFWKISTGGINTYLADSISIDVDLNYDVDVMYIGENDPLNDTAFLRRLTTLRGVQNDPSQWELSTLAGISSIGGAKDAARRITAAPAAAMDSSANLWVYFGSGKFQGLDDRNPDDTGAFYGIKDKGWKGDNPVAFTNLLDISKAKVKTDGTVTGVSGACGGVISNWSNLLSGSDNCDGWALFFGERGTGGESSDYTGTALKYKGEKMFTKPFILGGLVTWTTFIPGTDECTKDGESNVYAVYYETGTAYKQYVFSDQGTTDPVARVKNIGAGMASTVSGQETKDGKTKGIIKQSNGTIIEIENVTPVPRRSKVMGWSRKPIP
ncbi:MAG: hypothetical protein JSW20_06890 [Nitrospiraceae bacterium]|nr:MAG: hypothetical protein JSW20_06890 [Nitrospiraceae bacterium]